MVRKYMTRLALKQSKTDEGIADVGIGCGPTKSKVPKLKAKEAKPGVKKPFKKMSLVEEKEKKINRRKRTCGISNRGVGFLNLGTDELERISSYLDTQSALNLMVTCKDVHSKLHGCSGFWRLLCNKENFSDYSVLKKDSDEDQSDETEEDSEVEEPKPKSAKKKSSGKFPAKNSPKSTTSKRLCYSGEIFHDVQIPRSASTWRKVFLRGLAMRRNLCQGRFEMWRLFLTDKDSLPVKRMMHDTSFRELRSSHRNSKFNQRQRRVRIHRYWTEDYMVALQHRPGSSFNDLFVWEWEECQSPKFLYSYDLYPEYPNGLFPTAFFLWKNYLVLLPDTGYIRDERNLTSIVRAHDLSNNMKLVGSYDLPFDGCRRRVVRSGPHPPTEAAHLHKLGDKAVAVCRVPTFTMFVFNLPDCQLLTEVKLSLPLERPLEEDDLDQRFMMRANTMFFMFHPAHFFEEYEEEEEEDANPARGAKHGRLLMVNFEKFLRCEGHSKSHIEIHVDEKFDSPCDYIEKVAIIGRDRMACILVSGSLVIKDIVRSSSTICSTVTQFKIPCPEPLAANTDHDPNIHGDTDGPTMCVSREGNVILLMQHFEDGRKIFAYNVKSKYRWRQLYTIDLDNYGLNENPGYVSIDMDGNFVCAADLKQIVVWNSKTGRYIRTIDIPKHYNVREDPNEVIDRYCWKGHTDFAFAEDGIVIVHSQRDFPIAADVILFW